MEQYRTKSDDLFWAFEKVDDLCHSIEGAQIAIRILQMCETKEEIAYVAAGPVEDVLKRVGTPAIMVFERAAEANDRVKVGLSGAWIDKDDDVFDEWKRLMMKYGYWGKSPISPLDR